MLADADNCVFARLVRNPNDFGEIKCIPSIGHNMTCFKKGKLLLLKLGNQKVKWHVEKSL